jgi:hypothetical protein
MHKSFNYYDLIEQFQQPGCAICNLVLRDVERYIDAHLYEYVNEPETHAAARASRWLCATHSAQLVNYGASVLGMAILETAVLDELLKITAATPTPANGLRARMRMGSGGGAKLADQLEPLAECLACATLRRSQDSHVAALGEHINDRRLSEAYRTSDGLCLPHFRSVLRAAPGVNVETLVAIQSAHWVKLKAELQRFADKYDINHADDAMGAQEGDSWRRALTLLAGNRDVFGRGR